MEWAHSDVVALSAPEGTLTYSALLATSDVAARALLGARTDLAETRIAVLVPPGLTWITLVLGIWRAGGIAVPLPVTAPGPELERALEDADAETVIVTPETVDRVVGPAARLGVTVRSADELLHAGPSSEPAHAGPLPTVARERGALMLYTSGTTGRPKGVVHTHASLAAQVRSLHEAWGWTADDHVLLVLPLHDVHGIVNVLLCALVAGARCTVHPKFDAVTTWKSLESDGLTLFMAVPTIYGRLLTEDARADVTVSERRRAAARRLCLFVSGSAALPARTLEDWEAVTGHRLLERYGMTEIGMALSNPLIGKRVPGHVGKPLPGVEVRVTDDEDGVLPDGSEGELQVRGPQLFREYWRRPDETTSAFTTDGWFHTGDEVVVTPDGFRILGRRSVDILKSGGEKLSALEIEEVLRTHPEVVDCAVVGVADSDWGERVCAAVVARPNRSPEPSALRAWAAERLSPWKVPREVLLVAELPRNALGKVVKTEVRVLFGG